MTRDGELYESSGQHLAHQEIATMGTNAREMSANVFFDVSNRVGWLEGQGHRKSFGGRDLLPISVLNFDCRHRAEKGICVSSWASRSKG